ncbi:MAG: hypothetical protein DLM60_20145 [Pseudonocardiales bacterium]|nr:MAG: hypothetical protein DLM60_20145 [Pseudonocardiales bacterium]
MAGFVPGAGHAGRQCKNGDEGDQDEHRFEHTGRARTRSPQSGRAQAGQDHTDREPRVRKVHHRALRANFGVHTGGVDRYIRRAGSGAQQEQCRRQGQRGIGERGQDTRCPEQRHHDRQHPGTDAVHQATGQPHRQQRTEPDHQQSRAQLTIGRTGATLHCGQYGAPSSPEQTERHEAAERLPAATEHPLSPGLARYGGATGRWLTAEPLRP